MSLYTPVKMFIEKNIDILDPTNISAFLSLWRRHDSYETQQLLEVLKSIDIDLNLKHIQSDVRLSILKQLFNKRADEYINTVSIKVSSLKSKIQIKIKSYAGTPNYVQTQSVTQRSAKFVGSITSICEQFGWSYTINDIKFVEENKKSTSGTLYTYVYGVQLVSIGI